MYEFGEGALNLASKEGADEAEVYILTSKSTSADIRKSVIESAKEQRLQGMGIRAIVNGSVGFASTNIPGKIEEAVKKAVSSARIRENDPEWTSLPSNSKYPQVSGILDENIKNMELEKCIELTREMIEGAQSFPDVQITSGSFSRSYSNKMIMNTNGVKIREEDTAVSGFIDTITSIDDASTAYDFHISRNLDIDFFKIGKIAAQLALNSRKGTSINTHNTEIVLHPFAVSDLLDNSFVPSLNADNVQKERSCLKGRKGDQIASEDLTIIDNGLLENGIETSVCDDEGSPSKKTTIIENGIFKSYLYDSYTAGKYNVESTGNSRRHSYSSVPGIGPRNLIIDYPQSNIIEETNNGIYISSLIGAHTANSISGDFSVEARNAFQIKNGEIEKPIKSLMISGNIFDIFEHISGAGYDVQMVGGTVTPSIRVSDMKVIG